MRLCVGVLENVFVIVKADFMIRRGRGFDYRNGMILTAFQAPIAEVLVCSIVNSIE